MLQDIQSILDIDKISFSEPNGAVQVDDLNERRKEYGGIFEKVKAIHLEKFGINL